MVAAIAHRGPGRRRLPHRARRRPRPRAPQHHRPRRRRAAHPQRDRDRVDHLQRRGVQLHRAAPVPRAARPQVLHAHRHRSDRASVRGARRPLRRRAQRPVRVRALGSRAAPAAAGARSRRHPAAVLRADAGRRGVRAPRSRRCSRAACVPRGAGSRRSRRAHDVLGAASRRARCSRASSSSARARC